MRGVMLQPLIRQGYIPAQFHVDLISADTTRSKQNVRPPKEGWQQAAEQGNPEAQYYLGVMYNEGIGVRQDHEQAR